VPHLDPDAIAGSSANLSHSLAGFFRDREPRLHDQRTLGDDSPGRFLDRHKVKWLVD
jgi:hypothetical protein